MKRQETIFLSLFIFVAALLAGCAAPMRQYNYEPTKESAEKWQPDEAKATLKLFFSDCRSSRASMPKIKDFKVSSDHIEFTAISNNSKLQKAFNYRFEDFGKIRLVTYDSFDSPNFYHLGYFSSNNLNEYHTLLGSCVGNSTWNVEGAAKLADALLRLKLEYDNRKIRDDEEFRKVVSDYHTANRKPELSEEARKYRIQAELAVKDKRFDDAADRYSQALLIAPWWPEGHFNRALIFGELKRYGEAITEMNRYLQLTPAAPDARAARDKIYEWEDARKTAKAVHD